jgi:hypothetical protein
VQNPLQRRRNLLIGSLRQTVLLPEVENGGGGEVFLFSTKLPIPPESSKVLVAKTADTHHKYNIIESKSVK